MATLSDTDLLKALGLVPMTDTVSLGAIPLFGTGAAIERWVPNAEVLFQDLREGPLQRNERLLAPLLSVAVSLRDLIDRRNLTTELMAGLRRIQVPMIPQETRREAVANALVHRDYAMLGPVLVQLSGNEFTVANPGGFPPGVTVANILDQSRPRSPILAAAFKRAGLVERRGKGVNDMFADLDLVRFLLAFEDEGQRPLSLDELRVVHEVKASGSTSGTELVHVLGMLPATFRGIATRLIEIGILESRGVGRSRRYHLTARFYDRAQDRNAYVRVKGADPLQQERMIIDYARAYGRSPEVRRPRSVKRRRRRPDRS